MRCILLLILGFLWLQAADPVAEALRRHDLLVSTFDGEVRVARGAEVRASERQRQENALSRLFTAEAEDPDFAPFSFVERPRFPKMLVIGRFARAGINTSMLMLDESGAVVGDLGVDVFNGNPLTAVRSGSAVYVAGSLRNDLGTYIPGGWRVGTTHPKGIVKFDLVLRKFITDGSYPGRVMQTDNLTRAMARKLIVGGGYLYVMGYNLNKLNNADRSYIGRLLLSDGSLDAWDPQVNAPVLDAVHTDHGVYLGGTFTTLNAGAVTAPLLARVDVGTAVADASWTPCSADAYLTPPATASSMPGVMALVAHRGRLYAAGSYLKFPGCTAGNSVYKMVGFDIASGAAGNTAAWWHSLQNAALNISSVYTMTARNNTLLAMGRMYVGTNTYPYSAYGVDLNSGVVFGMRAVFNTASSIFGTGALSAGTISAPGLWMGQDLLMVGASNIGGWDVNGYLDTSAAPSATYSMIAGFDLGRRNHATHWVHPGITNYSVGAASQICAIIPWE